MTPVDEIRNQLHRHPGVSGKEEFAHDLIVSELQSLSPTAIHQHVGGYGVIAYWSSDDDKASTLAFRADIDALPTGHRCGHDGHTAILLAFARIVDSCKPLHNIVLIFQPEEETGRGAKKIVASGLLQQYGVKAVFGLHNLPGYPMGTVVLNPHTFAAASCGVIYRYIGRSTHASTPEKGISPAMAVASLIQRMDALNRKGSTLDLFRQSTLICCRVGEEAFGTAAGKGEVMFTLRAFTNSSMADLMRLADATAIDVLQSKSKLGCQEPLELEKQVRDPFRATENTPELVAQLHQIFDGEYDIVQTKTPFRWSEDFAEYLTVFPGAFFGIGSGEKQPELHNPAYNFPDDLIGIAARCFELIMKKISI